MPVSINIFLWGGWQGGIKKEPSFTEGSPGRIGNVFLVSGYPDQTIDSIPQIPQGHIPAQIPQPIQ